MCSNNFPHISQICWVKWFLFALKWASETPATDTEAKVRSIHGIHAEAASSLHYKYLGGKGNASSNIERKTNLVI